MANIPRSIKKFYLICIAAAALLLVIINPLGIAEIDTLKSNEFFLYHISDIIENLEEKPAAENDFYIATGTYEDQKDALLAEGGDLSELFGIAKGRNLIVIQMESFQNMMIGAEYNGYEITPVLNELIREEQTIYFDNYYQQIGSGNTSDAEFASNNSLIGSYESYTYQLFENNYFRGLPWLLKDIGYSTQVFHGYDKNFWNRVNIYPQLGFDRYYNADDFVSDNIEGIGGGNITGISDSAFFEQTSDYLEELSQPYYAFINTLSNHNPFGLPEYMKEISVLPEHEETLLGNYVNSIHYADKCIGEFYKELKERGLYDNSIIVMYGDHFGLSGANEELKSIVGEWLGVEYTCEKMMNVPLIIHIPGEQVNMRMSNSGGQIDLLPTLAYLMGFETLDTIYLGQNLFTGNDSIVAFQTYMLKGSFVKGDTVLEASRDGIFENSRAWNRLTGQPEDIAPYREDYEKAKQTVELSLLYLYNDVLRLALEQHMSIEEILAYLENDAEIPTKPECFKIAADDAEALDEYVKYMLENKETQAVIISDDIYGLLSEFEKKYGGKAEQASKLSTASKEVAEKFTDIRSRTIPLVEGTGSFSKIEYLGYSRIIVHPEFERTNRKELAEFVATSEPFAFALTMEEMETVGSGMMHSNIPVYAYGADTVDQQGICRILGAAGIIGKTSLKSE